jgi:circadian clock protein KaiC
MEVIERVPTGIVELDKILDGGFPRGAVTLIAGGPGTGKTILAAQFIYNGAIRYFERGIFVTFSESSEVLKQYMLTLGWDFDRLENEGKIKILDFVTMGKVDLDSLLDTIFEEARIFGAKRMVIDSITALIIAFRGRLEIRTTVSVIQKLLRKLGCTSIVISETPWGNKGLGSGVEEFIADGIIMLETMPLKGELKRRLTVLKMRGTNHDMKFYQYTITKDDGIVITPYPEVV